MTFAKAKSSKQQDFHLNNNKLDIVQEYTYLGIKLSSTARFLQPNRIIDLKRLKPKHANKLLESLLVPILTYGYEVIIIIIIIIIITTTLFYKGNTITY